MSRESDRRNQGMLRVLLLLDGEFCERDGRFAATRDRLHEFLNGLAGYGFAVTVASRCRPALEHEELLAEIVESEHLSFKPLPHYSVQSVRFIGRWFPWDAGRRRIAELISVHDIVIFRFNHGYAGRIASICRRLAKAHVCWWSGHPTAGVGGRTGLHRLLKRLVRRFQFAAMRRGAGSALNIVLDPGHVALLPRGVPQAMIVPSLVSEGDLQDSPPERSAGDPLRVIYAGRLTREKGVERILSLWEACRARALHVEFAIAGDGPMASTVQQAALEGSGLMYLGNLGSEALQAALRRAHVLALLSYSEGMPKILWEAWAAGLPVLATPVGGLTHVVQSGLNGLLIEADDLEGQLAFVKALEADDEARRALGATSIASIGSRTREQQLDVLAELLAALPVDRS